MRTGERKQCLEVKGPLCDRLLLSNKVSSKKGETSKENYFTAKKASISGSTHAHMSR